MKSPFAVGPLALTALLSLASSGAALAQTAAPSATIAPAKPAAETSTLTSSATVSPSPAAVAAKPGKEMRSPEEKAARKKARLEKYDTNKDGKLDKSERAAMRADKGLAPMVDKAASPTP